MRLVLLAVCLSNFVNSNIVSTPCGPIEGYETDGVIAFEGLVFGKAPRFQHSSVAECWNGIFNATSVGPACFTFDAPPQGMSEDCLNMNIYTSATTTKAYPVPVMLFVYGGGNLGGKNTDYDIRTLAKLMPDVLFVVPNYRLGTLGYLVHGPSGMYGNYGIGDIITSLKFIRPLLASFGGDSSKITLMGQSSGGTNILALLASPSANGLFQAGISLSGSPNISMSMQDTSTYHTKYILPAVGCDVPSHQVKECLLSRSPQNLTNGIQGITGAPPSVNPPNLPFSPNGNELIGLSIVDGVLVTKPLLEALSVPLVDVSLIIQTCQAETDPSLDEVDNLKTTKEYESWLQNYLNTNAWENSTYIGAKITQIYGKELSDTVELGFEAWLADLGVTCGNDQITKIASKSFKSPVYRTHLHTAPSHPYDEKKYAFHTWDMPVAGANSWRNSWTPGKSDIALGVRLRSMWRDMLYNGKLSSDFSIGGCNVIGDAGMAYPCETDKCPTLQDLGFDMGFWWVN